MVAFKCKEGPELSKEQLVNGLVDLNLCRKIPGRLKADAHYMPVLRFKNALENVICHKNRDCEVELPEVYNMENFNTYVHGNACRRDNATVLATVYSSAAGRKKHRGAGRETEEVTKHRESMLERGRKLQAAETLSEELVEELGPSLERERKKRRQEHDVKEEQEEVTVQCGYHYSGDTEVRTCKPERGNFLAEHILFLLENTYDLDISNSMFTLLPQLMEKVDTQPALPGPLQEIMQRVRDDRTKLCEEDLGLSVPEGKRIVTAVFRGSALPAAHAQKDALHRLQKASRWYRWAAASLLPEEYIRLCADTSKRNPKVSVLSLLFCACEDYILTRWIHFLNAKYRFQHMSLHFDGVRVSKEPSVQIEALCTLSEEHIKSTSSFAVTILEKQHGTVFACIKKRAEETLPPKHKEGHCLRRAGYCISHALHCLGSLTVEGIHKVFDVFEPVPEAAVVALEWELMVLHVDKVSRTFLSSVEEVLAAFSAVSQEGFC
eukprot:s2897_g2.t1